MAAKKKPATQTLNEFKAWLEGVEELQAKNWCPDKSQWTKIRKRINQIVEPTPAPAIQNIPVPQGPLDVSRPAPPASPFVPPNVDISPAAQALLNGGSLPGGIPTTAPAVTNMPDGTPVVLNHGESGDASGFA